MTRDYTCKKCNRPVDYTGLCECMTEEEREATIKYHCKEIELKKYTVTFTKSFTYVIDVTAKDKEQAREFAEEIINKKTETQLREESQSDYWEYSYTDEV